MSNKMLLGPEEFAEIEDVNVYLDEGGSSRSTDLREVRDAFYGRIEELLSRNDYGDDKLGSDAMNRNNRESQAEKDKEDWLQSLEDVNAEMIVETAHNAYEFQLFPRTDFSLEGVQTAPNIMKGRYEGSTEVAIREWSHYKDDEGGVGPGNILTSLHRHGTCFNRNSHDDDFYESIGTEEYSPQDFDGGITMIPELLLGSAFHKEEGINDQLAQSNVAGPVFPHTVQLVDLYDDMAFAMRPWWNKSLDGGIYDGDEEQFGTLYGTLEGLNLVTCFDREDEFIDERVNGNTYKTFFDPEFVAFAESDKWFEGSDWEDFRDQLQKHGGVGEGAIESIKDRKDRVADSFDSRINVLEELPKKVDGDLFPKDKIVDTRI